MSNASASLSDAPEAIAADVAAVGRIAAVPTMLRVLCETTGMGFAAVARVTEGTWTACAVHDTIGFGLASGAQLDVDTTLCKEVRGAREPIIIDHASRSLVYCTHHTPRLYGIESYVSVPIVLPGGTYFGNLCAIDPKPADVSTPKTRGMFTLFAELVALQLADELERERMLDRLAEQQSTAGQREEFIAVLGHDLRTPLSAVSFAAQLLRVRADNPAQVRQTADRIDASVRRMTSLIDEMTDFARGRLAGGLAIRRDVVADLSRGLREIVDEQALQHGEGRIDARIAVDRPVCVDAGRVQQLLANLLANAFAHGAADGRIVLDVRLAGDDLVLDVHNEGEPIEPAAMQHIFEPFWRGPRRLAGSDGLGLGLHIAHEIVRAHGGTIDVRSSAATGTTFSVRLPAVAALTAPA